MKNRQLPVNLVSLLGRNLQFMLGDKFSESFLNRILRLLMDVPVNVTRSLAWPSDTIIYPYRVVLFSSNYRKNFNDFMRAPGTGLKDKKILIKVILTCEKPSGIQNRLSIDQETIFELLESVLFYLNKGVQLFYTDIDASALKEKTEKGLINLITAVVHFVNPSALIITREGQFTNDSWVLSELNKIKL